MSNVIRIQPDEDLGSGLKNELGARLRESIWKTKKRQAEEDDDWTEGEETTD